MPGNDPGLQRSVQDVAAAYKRHAEHAREDGYRGVWSYVAAKALSDWALLAGIDLRGKRVLNVGCCEPIDELFFARQGMRCWVGVDVSQPILVVAREILDRELSPSFSGRIVLCAADAGWLPFPDDVFDLVVSFSALEHIPDTACPATGFRGDCQSRPTWRRRSHHRSQSAQSILLLPPAEHGTGDCGLWLRPSL